MRKVRKEEFWPVTKLYRPLRILMKTSKLYQTSLRRSSQNTLKNKKPREAKNCAEDFLCLNKEEIRHSRLQEEKSEKDL